MKDDVEWLKYERLVYEECLRVFDKAIVRYNEKIKGKYSLRMRQIDILLSQVNIDGSTFTVAIDTKHYKNKIDVKCVEAFIGMLRDIDVNIGIIISDIGFTKSAINRAINSPDNIQIDIMSMLEFSQFQGQGGIVYSNNIGAIIKSPFGWILDAQQYGFSPAVLYRRGTNFLEALHDLDFIYINFFHHEREIHTRKGVCEFHNVDINKCYNNPEIIITDENGILTRTFYNPIRECYDITAYRDCKNYTIFATLLTKKDFKSVNIQKLLYTVNSLIFLDVVQTIERDNCLRECLNLNRF